MVSLQISLADYAVFDILVILNRFQPGSLDQHTLLNAFHHRMASRDRIKAYLARDDVKQMPTTGSGRF